LYRAKERGFPNIIEIENDGIVEINGNLFPYYTMEKADTDLKECLLYETQFDIQEKFNLCKNIFFAIKQLHSLGIYHRDIKPDNVFMFESTNEGDNAKKFTWKLGDLGLISERDKDYDDLGERIGPFGWISPEAMNKFLTERAKLHHDCKIDEKSDIFQLGELFWFIFMLNSPIGQIYSDDFNCDTDNADEFFETIKTMLSHQKAKRFTVREVENKLLELEPGFGI
jgi:serine/threonine protein kinase